MTDLSAEVRQELGRSLNPPCHRTTRTITVDFDGYQRELEVSIRYVAEPSEPRTYDYPGYAGWVEILDVYVGTMNVTELLGKELIEAMQDSIRGPV